MVGEAPIGMQEAAEYLRISKHTLYRLIEKGEVTHYRPSYKKILFKQSDLEAYAFGNRIASRGAVEDEAEKILGGIQ